VANDKATLIVSGGMDSATLAYYYDNKGFDVHLVGFNYGQRHSKELLSLELIAKDLGATWQIVDLSNLRDALTGSSLTSDDVEVPDGHYAEETMRATVVPNRNMIMIAIASGIAVANGSRLVATGVHAGDHFIYPDCRPDFIEYLDNALIEGTQGHAAFGFHLEAPFVHISKAQIAEIGKELNVPYELTWSCYKGGDLHCARCGTCVERIEAFINAGMPDPTKYAESIEFALEEIEKKKQ
jgi:7-cyano-7-deazaguanine synthase